MIHYFLEIFIGLVLFLYNTIDVSTKGEIFNLYTKEKFLLLIIHFLLIIFVFIFGIANQWNFKAKNSIKIKSFFINPLIYISLNVFMISYMTNFIWMKNYEGILDYWYIYNKLKPFLLWAGFLITHFLILLLLSLYKEKNVILDKNLFSDFFHFLLNKTFILYILVLLISISIFFSANNNFYLITSYESILSLLTLFLLFCNLIFFLFSIKYLNIQIKSKTLFYFSIFSLFGIVLFEQLLLFSNKSQNNSKSLLFILSLHPLFFILFLFSFFYFITLYVIGFEKKEKNNYLKSHKKIYFISFFFLFLIAFMIINYKFVIVPDNRFWNGAGNPIFFSQILLSISILLIIYFLTKKYINNQKFFRFLDIIIIIFIIFVSIASWKWAPNYNNYFISNLTKPNFEYYPYSDARKFDFGGEYLEYGYGINNYKGTTNPFTMFLIFIYHQIAGDNYIKIFHIQMIVAFLVPIGVYLIGNAFGSKEAGITTALLVIFQESNAIELSGKISNVNIQLLMSEIPTLILLIWGTLFFINHMKTKNSFDIINSGLLLGFASLSRMNPLFVFIAYTFILIILVIKKKTKIKSLLKFEFSFSIIFLGWYTSIYFITGRIFFLDKIRGVINRSAINEPIINILAAKLSPISQLFNDFYNLLYALINHFIHNLFNVFMVLPLNIINSNPIDLNNINMKFWDPNNPWNGNLTLFEIIMIFINFLIIIYGLIHYWNKNKSLSLIPLILLFSYSAALGAARTSGGRYLTPINWTVVFYYASGIWFLLKKIIPNYKNITSNKDSLNSQLNKIKPFLTIFLLFILVTMIVLPFIIPKRITLKEIEIKNIFTKTYIEYNISLEEINMLLEKDYILLDTIAFYPSIDKEHTLTAKIIDNKYQNIIFPVENDNFLIMPNKSNIYILGYPTNSNSILVYQYIIIDEQGNSKLFKTNEENFSKLLSEW